MTKISKTPDFIFESSWEVCNKIGGIYTVLSTRAKTMQSIMEDKVVFIGPDHWDGKENPLFKEDRKILKTWAAKAKSEGLKVRTGRWNIPGEPIVVLVDFKEYFEKRDELYGELWEIAGIDSTKGYGDYDEANMFSYAAYLVVESIYRNLLKKNCRNVVYQVHEWMCCLGAMFMQKYVPEIATVFTTHATTIGRSIAGNNKPLYDYLWAYNGIQMSQELNVEAKHNLERETAHRVDCFTTVSSVTGRECEELLDIKCPVILPNGFEADFVPKGAAFANTRAAARKRIFDVANALTGQKFDDDTLIVATSGRYEFRNKGIDVFLEAMNRSLRNERLAGNVLALVQVPAWVGEPRVDLQERMALIDKGGLETQPFTDALDRPVITHDLHNMDSDSVTGMLKYFDMWNRPEDKVKVIFIPCYLDGKDGIFGRKYYDMLIGNDLSVYPSYYEPWGYTPLESIAFHVPCVTTTLSGFGMWANSVKGDGCNIMDGVEVIPRTDYNYSEVADRIKDCVAMYSMMSADEVEKARKAAHMLSRKALWKNFIKYYEKAYEVALTARDERMQGN
ncbi:MAG: glycosyl transferase [Bacteroidaceae bacterium]|nr:glycosyl transferase [Bacteroidaceae bacterium]